MEKKDRLVYSTEKDKTAEDDLKIIAQKMRQAENARNPHAFAQILIELGEDPDSESFKKRLAAFRRACGLD